jgi:hypothetical protein
LNLVRSTKVSASRSNDAREALDWTWFRPSGDAAYRRVDPLKVKTLKSRGDSLFLQQAAERQAQ